LLIQTAAGIWDELDGHNQAVAALFAELEKASSTADYQTELGRLGQQLAEAWTGPLGKTLTELRGRFLHARRLLKTMGDKSGVAVEPDQQSRLLDATMALPGVLIAGVPGARRL
jgi:phosphomevalonate kinase